MPKPINFLDLPSPVLFDILSFLLGTVAKVPPTFSEYPTFSIAIYRHNLIALFWAHPRLAVILLQDLDYQTRMRAGVENAVLTRLQKPVTGLTFTQHRVLYQLGKTVMVPFGWQ
jgi:hypothetical protein